MATYPKYLSQIKDLVEQHLELVDEPLELAIYYSPDREPDDVFLFEIFESFKGGALSYDEDLLEVLYGATEHFTLHSRTAMLHIVMASPEEFWKAADRETPRIVELRHAFSTGNAQVVYNCGTCGELMKVMSQWPILVHG